MTIPNEARMKTFKNKNCLICSISYTPTGCSSKYCKPCSENHWKSKSAEYQQAHRIRTGKIQMPGVGKGGNVKRGKEHHSFTTGIGCDFQDIRKDFKEERRYCNRCNEDLINADRYHWCVHHIDHDRTNNIQSNFELLCKRCHQIEHDCVEAFGNA